MPRQVHDCPELDGRLSNYYLVVFFAGGPVEIRQRSTAFDAYLELFDARGALVAADDNGGGGSDAFVRLPTTTHTGVFIIRASSAAPGQSGAYELELRGGEPPDR